MHSMFNHVITVFIQYLEPCALKLEYVSPRGHPKICLSREKWQFLFPQFIPFICDISIPYTSKSTWTRNSVISYKEKHNVYKVGRMLSTKFPNLRSRKRKNFIGVNSLQTGTIQPLWTLQV